MKPIEAHRIVRELQARYNEQASKLATEGEREPAPVPQAPDDAENREMLVEAAQADAAEGGDANEKRVVAKIAAKYKHYQAAVDAWTKRENEKAARLQPLRARLDVLEEAYRVAEANAAEAEREEAESRLLDLQPKYGQIVGAALDLWAHMQALSEIAGRSLGSVIPPLFQATGLPEGDDLELPEGFYFDQYSREIKFNSMSGAIRAREAAIVAEWRAV